MRTKRTACLACQNLTIVGMEQEAQQPGSLTQTENWEITRAQMYFVS